MLEFIKRSVYEVHVYFVEILKTRLQMYYYYYVCVSVCLCPRSVCFNKCPAIYAQRKRLVCGRERI